MDQKFDSLLYYYYVTALGKSFALPQSAEHLEIYDDMAL